MKWIFVPAFLSLTLFSVGSSEECFLGDKDFEEKGTLKGFHEECKGDKEGIICVEKKLGIVVETDTDGKRFDFDRNLEVMKQLTNGDETLKTLSDASRECKEQYDEKEKFDEFHECWFGKLKEICKGDEILKE